MQRISIATPVSFTMARDRETWDSVLALSDVLELRDNTCSPLESARFIYHSEQSLIASWGAEERDHLRSMAGRYRIEAASFHLSSRYQENEIRERRFHGIGKPLGTDEMLNNANTNSAFAREVLGSDVPVLLENNNHLGTDAYDTVTEGGFITEVVTSAGLYLLWDLAHSIITSLNTGLPLGEQIASLPLKKCMQVHLSGHGVEDGLALDSHDPPGEEEWELLRRHLPEMPEIRYATIEYYKSPDMLVSLLRLLRRFLDETRKGAGG